MSERAQTIADELVNQAELGIDDVCTPEERDDPEFLAELDTLVFCCEDCGWWCEIGEMSSRDQICGDCHDDEEEE